MEHHNFEWENSVYMANFNSYVKLPEGIRVISIGHHMDTMDQWNIMEYHGIWNSIEFTS